MNDVLFINEEYFKKNISHKQNFDSNQVISTVRLVQKTNLISIVTEAVYDSFQKSLKDVIEFTEGEQRLFESMQLYLAVKSAEEMSYAAPNRDIDDNDGSALTYRNKARLLEARIVRDINRDADILTLAQTDSVQFDDGEMNVTGGFYFD